MSADDTLGVRPRSTTQRLTTAAADALQTFAFWKRVGTPSSDVDDQVDFVTSAVSSRKLGGLSSHRCSQLGGELERLLTFRGHESLLRASRLTTLFRRAGGIFSSSHGSDATYGLSDEVKTIDVFLSHNWVVSRIDKFVALACHFNAGVGMVAMLLTATVVGILGFLDVVPMVRINRATTGGFAAADEAAILGDLLLFPVFIVTTFTCRDFMWMCGLRGPTVFLDKVCIHQRDQTLQKAGIERLGGFIRCSKTMLVLYSEVYLRKLWTVYEVASFLCMHKAEDMVVLPVSQSRLFFVSLTFCFFYANLSKYVYIAFGQGKVGYVVGLLLAFMYISAQRWWATEKRNLLKRVAHFNVRKCLCACEEDRPIVYKNIAVLMKASMDLDRNASEAQALDAFNDVVRQELFQRFTSCFGTFSFRYYQFVMFGCSIALGNTVDDVTRLHLDRTAEQVLAFSLLQLAWIAGCWPLMAMFCEYLASHVTDLSGCREWAWRVLLTLIAAVVCSVAYGASEALSIAADTSDVAFAALVVMVVFIPVVAAVICAGWSPLDWCTCRCWRSRRQPSFFSSQASSMEDCRSDASVAAAIPPEKQEVFAHVEDELVCRRNEDVLSEMV